MNRLQKSGLLVAVIVALALGVVIGMNFQNPVIAQGGKGGGGGGSGARYSVVETEGVHLIVTDNQKNTVYFYTVNEGDKPGADLHLRGSIDLTKVGDATIKPALIEAKK